MRQLIWIKMEVKLDEIISWWLQTTMTDSSLYFTFSDLSDYIMWQFYLNYLNSICSSKLILPRLFFKSDAVFLLIIIFYNFYIYNSSPKPINILFFSSLTFLYSLFLNFLFRIFIISLAIWKYIEVYTYMYSIFYDKSIRT